MMSSLQSFGFIVLLWTQLPITGAAEGKNNPFSFRQFVARKEKQKDKVTVPTVTGKPTHMLDSWGMPL